MIEFEQILGRGTRLNDGKDYCTIYDFVKAHHHFSDPEWDGDPLEPEPKKPMQSGERPGPPYEVEPSGGNTGTAPNYCQRVTANDRAPRAREPALRRTPASSPVG